MMKSKDSFFAVICEFYTDFALKRLQYLNLNYI